MRVCVFVCLCASAECGSRSAKSNNSTGVESWECDACIYAEKGCHKCLSIPNDKMYENEVKYSGGILCVGRIRKTHFTIRCSFAHETENDAVYAIRIIILEIRIRKLSAMSAFYVRLCCSQQLCLTNHYQFLIPARPHAIAAVVVLRFSCFLCFKPFFLIFFGSLLRVSTIWSAACHTALEVRYAMCNA